MKGQKETQKQRISEGERISQESEMQKISKGQKLAEEQKISEAQKLAEEQKISEGQKLAEEQKISEAQRLAEEQKISEGQKLAEEQKILKGQKLAEKQKILEEQRIPVARQKKSREWFPIMIGFIFGVLVMGVLVLFLFLYTSHNGKEYIIRSLINRYYLSEVDEDALQDGKYKGMVDALGDDYSKYFTIDETDTKKQANQGTYQGIGIVLSQDTDTGVMTVVRCYADSPAEEAGIQAGDILYQVNGQEVDQMVLNDVVTMIRESGEDGAALTLLRDEREDYLEVTVVPKAIEYPMVQSQMIDEEIGYLAIYDFVDTTYEQFNAQLEELKGQGMTRLILDLRNNTGGLMTSVTDILNSILPKGVMVYTIDKEGKREDYLSDGKTPLELPMVVLVNEYTASASEIFAGAVRDYDMAQLVGTKTFGKGIVQGTFFLTDGSAVKLTSASYYTPKGKSIHGEGLMPDVEIELNTEPDGNGYVFDNQLEKAVEVIKNME